MSRGKLVRFLAAWCACSAIVLPLGAAAPDDFDEAAFFGEDSIIVTNSTAAGDPSATNAVFRSGASWSGTLASRFSWRMHEDWFAGAGDANVNTLSTSMEFDLLFDLRLLREIKGFASASLRHSPQGFVAITALDLSTNRGAVTTNRTEFVLRELFIDVTIDRAVYLRLGRQVLQWGRGFYWNPTDLVNVERREVTDLERLRSGAYALRVHVPFGTAVNLYSVIDMTDADSLSGLAFAGKAEFLVGRTEFAFSAWARDGKRPVYGFDIATRALGIDWRGEAAVSFGDDRWRVTQGGGVWIVDRPGRDELSLKAVLGGSTSFDWELKDRIAVSAELAYDRFGYAESPFADPLALITLGSRLAEFWQPNRIGRWYGGLFVSVAQFPDSTAGLSANLVANLADGGMLATLGLVWRPVRDFTAAFSLFGTFGPERAEYTLSGRSLAVETKLSLAF